MLAYLVLTEQAKAGGDIRPQKSPSLARFRSTAISNQSVWVLTSYHVLIPPSFKMQAAGQATSLYLQALFPSIHLLSAEGAKNVHRGRSLVQKFGPVPFHLLEARKYYAP